MAPLTWLVTGCSAGFGEQFVKSIVARGDNVVATARKLSSIERFKGEQVAVMELDITAPEEVLTARVREATAFFGSIDVLVNNAGFVHGAPFELISNEQLRAQFETNYFGTLSLTRAVLPHFRDRRSGHIVFVGSVAGVEGEPCGSAYAGSKSALSGSADSIGHEVAQFGIKTYYFQIGRCRTGVIDPSKGFSVSETTISDYEQMNEAVKSGVESILYKQPGDPVRVVEVIVDSVRGEGAAKGKSVPPRLPMGSDALDCLRRRAQDMLKVCDEWETVIRSIDFEEGQ